MMTAASCYLATAHLITYLSYDVSQTATTSYSWLLIVKSREKLLSTIIVSFTNSHPSQFDKGGVVEIERETYHDVFGGEDEAVDEGLHGVQELHAPRNVQREPQGLVLVHHNP